MKKTLTLLLTTIALVVPTLALAQTDDTLTTTDDALYCPHLVTTFAQGASDRMTDGQVSELQRTRRAQRSAVRFAIPIV